MTDHPTPPALREAVAQALFATEGYGHAWEVHPATGRQASLQHMDRSRDDYLSYADAALLLTEADCQARVEVACLILAEAIREQRWRLVERALAILGGVGSWGAPEAAGGASSAVSDRTNARDCDG